MDGHDCGRGRYVAQASGTITTVDVHSGDALAVLSSAVPSAVVALMLLDTEGTRLKPPALPRRLQRCGSLVSVVSDSAVGEGLGLNPAKSSDSLKDPRSPLSASAACLSCSPARPAAAHPQRSSSPEESVGIRFRLSKAIGGRWATVAHRGKRWRAYPRRMRMSSKPSTCWQSHGDAHSTHTACCHTPPAFAARLLLRCVQRRWLAQPAHPSPCNPASEGRQCAPNRWTPAHARTPHNEDDTHVPLDSATASVCSARFGGHSVTHSAPRFRV